MLLPHETAQRNYEIYLHQKLALHLHFLSQKKVLSLTQSPNPETGKLFKETPIFYQDSIQVPRLVNSTSQIFLKNILSSSPTPLFSPLLASLVWLASHKFFPLSVLPLLTYPPPSHHNDPLERPSEVIPFYQSLHCCQLGTNPFVPLNYEQIRAVALSYSALYLQDLVHCLAGSGLSPVFS